MLIVLPFSTMEYNLVLDISKFLQILDLWAVANVNTVMGMDISI